MRRIFQALPIFCTLLLFGLGAFLPRLAALAFDRQFQREVVELEYTNLSLALEQETDFFQILELFGGGYSQVELSDGYHMNTGEAEAAAIKARGLLPASDTSYEVPKVMPLLFTSRAAPNISGVFWQCVWSKPSATPEILWLDDQSGRMVSFAGQIEWSSLSSPNSFFPRSALDVAEYCRLNYPVDTVELALANEKDPDGRYTVTLMKSRDGHEQTYSISMRLVDGWLYFNT